MDIDTDVLIIGAGMSGLGLAVQLVRNFGTHNFELIEKSTDIGGTWWVNSYPGCGCDVKSHFYSYSFAPNPDWTQAYAMQPEIYAYFKSVAEKYDVVRHVRFQRAVEDARWDEVTGTWVVSVRDLKTGAVTERRAKVLVTAVGALSTPKKCDIPGASAFEGSMFHTAEWDHSFNWKNKQVVVIGNGCSATQAVPAMSMGAGAAARVTQFSRQAHWLAERPNPPYSSLFKWTMRWVPLAMRLYRAAIFAGMESEFAGFDTATGKALRKRWADARSAYIRRMAPEKYHEFLMPKTEVGCKRRVNDTDYLACLHRENVELVYDDPAREIIQGGVVTESGRLVPADAIVLATGFETQKLLAPMNIYGERGQSINEHWQEVSEGNPSAYFGTCISGFPNFFVMMGPNTVTGHLSVIYTTECQINFTLRIIGPVLRALRASRSSLSPIGFTADVVQVTPEAEKRDVDWVQEKAEKLVWATGCTSWAVDPTTNRNTALYPDWPFKYWLRHRGNPGGDVAAVASVVAIKIGETLTQWASTDSGAGRIVVPRERIQQERRDKRFEADALHVVICGPSGSGKSSVVNALIGLRNSAEEAASTGTVETMLSRASYAAHDSLGALFIHDVPGLKLYLYDSVLIVPGGDLVGLVTPVNEGCLKIEINLIRACIHQGQSFVIVRSCSDELIRRISDGEDCGASRARQRHIELTVASIRDELERWDASVGVPGELVELVVLVNKNDLQRLAVQDSQEWPEPGDAEIHERTMLKFLG